MHLCHPIGIVISRSRKSAILIEAEFFTICKSINNKPRIYYCYYLLVMQHLFKRVHHIICIPTCRNRRAHVTYIYIYNIIYGHITHSRDKHIVEITLYTSPQFLWFMTHLVHASHNTLISRDHNIYIVN